MRDAGLGRAGRQATKNEWCKPIKLPGLHTVGVAQFQNLPPKSGILERLAGVPLEVPKLDLLRDPLLDLCLNPLMLFAQNRRPETESIC